jgi:2-amino-4-hydroxy-6-hydroxymethyldihydropteridine diphosphokinase
MNYKEVFVGLGGNIGDSAQVLLQAVEMMDSHASFDSLRVSRFYRTLPVSTLPQADYINAVCCFKTFLPPLSLLFELQKIENKLGKLPKAKQEPRVIDCDILFYGDEVVSLPELEIPHPRWRERLFVLQPLADLVDRLQIPGIAEPISLQSEIKSFVNRYHEIVTPIEVNIHEKSRTSS